jgi:type III pantothenate kinase
MMGTATVVDAVSPQGAYLGGMIAPGIATMADALAVAASALAVPQWAFPRQPIGASTVDSLTSGLFYTALGGLAMMVRSTRGALGTPAPIVLTGGWAQAVAPFLDGVAVVDEHLVLRGIASTISHTG